MEVDILTGLIATTITSIGGVIMWAVRTVTLKHVAFIDATNETQKEILGVVKRMASEMGLARELDRMRRVLAKVAPLSFICDDCGGWFGPGQRAGYPLCVCEERKAADERSC